MLRITKTYSRYVSLMKIILPVGIAFSIGLVVVWPYFTSLNYKENLGAIDPSQPDIQENRMLKPQYMSTDKKGQPYVVNAEWATQQTENRAHLKKPQGSLTLIKGQTVNIEAQNGVYDSNTKILNLEGDVTLTSTDGYHVKTAKANVSLDNKTVTGNQLIEGEGPTGAIRGQEGFEIKTSAEGKKVITLKGRSRVEINMTILKNNKESYAQ